MEQQTAPTLPKLTIENIQQCPIDRPVIFLMRHSARGVLPKDGTGDTIPLTEDGIVLGTRFGEILQKVLGVQVVSMHSSPVLRCRQTADALMEGLKYKIAVDITPNLTLPGPFILDLKTALATWHVLGGEEVLHRMSSEIPGDLPGMPPMDSAVKSFVRWMFSTVGNQAGIHMFITHDSIVLPVAAQIAGVSLGMEDWPAFLDGVLMWKEEAQQTTSESEDSPNKIIRCLYRNFQGQIHA